MNAELVKVGDTIIGKDGSPMKVLDVEHVYEGDGPGMNLRQILITLRTEDQPHSLRDRRADTEKGVVVGMANQNARKTHRP